MEKNANRDEMSKVVDFIMSMSYEEMMNWRHLFHCTEALEKLAENCRDDEEADVSCIVLIPEGEVKVMMTSEAEEYVERDYELVSENESFVLYSNMDDVVILGNHVYFVGPALICELDEYGNLCEIGPDTVSRAIEYMTAKITTIEVDGESYTAIRAE